MYGIRSNETQILYKMHFHKTMQDLPNNYTAYNIHKNFESVDTSELSVENIINTVFFNTEDKRHAQICAQTYICHRIIRKATELKLIPLFYRDHYKHSESLYEEPTYILIKNKIAGIARNILGHHLPVIFLRRCSVPKIKKKTSKQKKRKKSKSYVLEESLRSVVGKFPTLIIPKLSPKEIEYYVKDKYRNFDLQKNSITKKKNNTLKKTKNINKNEENFLPYSETRRSSRLRLKAEKMGLNSQKYFHSNFSLLSEKNILEVENQFQKDITNETYLQEDFQRTENYFEASQLKEGHSNSMTGTYYPLNDHSYHFHENNECLSAVKTSFNQDNDEIPETRKKFSNEIVQNKTDDEKSSANDEQQHSMVISEPIKYYKRLSSVHLKGNYTFEFVLKTQMDVDEDTCQHLNAEVGLDKNVIASLHDLYKSVHEGKNNYIFCEVSY